MLRGANEPTLARDTMFAVLMIILNGMVGLALLVGALRRREQHYNLQGAKAFLAVIIPLAVLTLILPDFTMSAGLPAFTPVQAAFFGAMTIGLYGVFLAVQTVRHKNLFMEPGVRARLPNTAPDPLAHVEAGREHGQHEMGSVPFHAALLALHHPSRRAAVQAARGVRRLWDRDSGRPGRSRRDHRRQSGADP